MIPVGSVVMRACTLYIHIHVHMHTYTCVHTHTQHIHTHTTHTHTMVNIGLGLTIFSQGRSRFEDLTILWVYLPYALFLIVLTGILLLVFSILTCTVNKAGKSSLPFSALFPFHSFNCVHS